MRCLLSLKCNVINNNAAEFGQTRYIRIFFSDFSKGFDLVDLNVLLSELNNLDVDPHLVRWIAAFLTNRSQRVGIGNSLSHHVGLNVGTPQGTKLAPLLFRILVNGMAAKCKSRIKHVDDATAMEIIPRCSPSHLTYHLQYPRSIHMLP